jgi:hypothetical protein
MDVAYRLCPAVDLWEMLGDVQRAIAWLKAQAGEYGLDPGKIVLGGGSAGGHLALLAAYTAGDARFTPPELLGADLSAGGVVSYYGPTDLCAFFQQGFGKVNLRSEAEKIQRNLPGGPSGRHPVGFRASIASNAYSLGLPGHPDISGCA